VRAALGAGETPDEGREVIIASAGLAGFPAAWTAMVVAGPILAEHEAAAGEAAAGEGASA
jgi:alkylhydroperoxidase/carboxymuconolactone decarboxylase family protein YurZ